MRARDLAPIAMLAACAGEQTTPKPVTVVTTQPEKSHAPVKETVNESRAPDEADMASCLAEPVRMADEKFSPKPLSTVQQERLTTLLAGVEGQCMSVNPDAPPRFRGPFAIPPAECKYEIARIYFESQRWVEAARWFRRITFEHSESDTGIFAAQLYLESLNVLATRANPQRPSCYEVMRADVDPIACMYCRITDNAEQCRMLRSIRFDLAHFDAAKPYEREPDSPCPEGQARAATGCHPLPPLVPDKCR